MRSDVLISVIVPCRNERRRLAACLDALAAQDFPPDRHEVIVVDGGSTDGSRELAKDRGLLVLDDAGTGVAAARNAGIHVARGEVVAFTDSDCAPRPDWLTRIAEVFAEDPSVGGVAGSLRMPRRTLVGRLEDLEARAYYRGVITSNVAYRRDVLLAVGGFDETLECAEDYDLAWRAQDAGYRVVHDPRPVVLHSPPEVDGGIGAYLRKHVWYARHDVPAQALALRRAARGAPGSAGAIPDAAVAATNAMLVFTLLTARRSPRWSAVSLAVAGAGAYRRAWRAQKACGERGETARMGAIVALRRVARGLGTLAGVAELAHPRRWRALSGSGEASLAPSAPRGAPPQGVATRRLPS